MGKRTLVRSRHRWKDNLKIYIQNVGCWAIVWIDLAKDSDRWRALVNAVMNFEFVKWGEFLDWMSNC